MRNKKREMRDESLCQRVCGSLLTHSTSAAKVRRSQNGKLKTERLKLYFLYKVSHYSPNAEIVLCGNLYGFEVSV